MFSLLRPTLHLVCIIVPQMLCYVLHSLQQNLIVFGDKTKARELAINAGVSVVPGTTKPLTTTEEAEAFVEQYGLPVMIKAAKGGGGKGMRVVDKTENLIPLFNAASSEALASFGDGGCFVERYGKIRFLYKNYVQR